MSVRTSSGHLRRWPGAFCLLVVAVAVTGCTSSGSSAQPSSSGPSTSVSPTSSGPSSTPAVSATSSASAGKSAKQTGGINQIVPSGTLTTAPPIPLSSAASFGNGVHAKITSIKAVNVPAHGIGEIAGPGVRIAIAISNDTAKSISLDEISITIENAQQNPGVQMSASRPAQGKLAAHRTAHGVYEFTIPKAHRNPLTVNMSYSVKTPVVLFVGTVR